MSIFEDTNPRYLRDLLGEIHEHVTVLPDFQRSFVWDPGATQELIVSIASNYPAGSILRVRDSQKAFAAREFKGAPPLNGKHHTFLVLDGQQRLTSLYQAFYGVGEHRYYLDLEKLIKGSEFEEAIFHERVRSRRSATLEEPTTQSQQLILPLHILRRGTGGFLGWMLNVTNELPADERTSRLDQLQNVNQRWIQAIDGYQFPVVTLSDRTDADALCTIFETLNRTGVKLSVFELLTARFWPQGISLRDYWHKAKSDYPIIEEYEVDPYYLLQAITLAARTAPSAQRSDILNLTAPEIREWWPKVVSGMVDALEILQTDCFVLLPKWIPYSTMLAPMAAILARSGSMKTAAAGARREKLKRWFWCSVFGQRYESGANSQSAKDVLEVAAWVDGGDLPEAIGSFRFDPRILRDTTPRQRSVYRGAICLALGARGGALDFHKAKAISRSLILAEGIDDHHIFPAKYLEKQQDIKTAGIRDCVLNRTLIDRTTNQMISDRAPSQYMKEIRDTPDHPYEKVMESHLLPTGKSSPFWTDDYEAFLEWRQTRLWAEIQRVTGATEAADLELEDSDQTSLMEPSITAL